MHLRNRHDWFYTMIGKLITCIFQIYLNILNVHSTTYSEYVFIWIQENLLQFNTIFRMTDLNYYVCNIAFHYLIQYLSTSKAAQNVQKELNNLHLSDVPCSLRWSWILLIKYFNINSWSAFIVKCHIRLQERIFCWSERICVLK